MVKDETLAEGVWCRNCEYFEDPQISNGRCNACGCDAIDHVEAEVVTAQHIGNQFGEGRISNGQS